MSELRDLVPEQVPSLGELRFGTPRGWVSQLPLDEATAAAWRRVAAGVPEVDFPDRARLHDVGLTILAVEAFDYHRRWLEEAPEKYGADVLANLKVGSEMTRQQHVAALLEQARLRAAAEDAMGGLDAVLLPVTPYTAPLIGQQLQRGTLLGFTRPFNTTGQPVIAVPAPSTGLPVGIQVAGRFGRERDLVVVALALESAWRNLS